MPEVIEVIDGHTVILLANIDDAKQAAAEILESTEPMRDIYIGPSPRATSVDSDSMGLVLGAIVEKQYAGETFGFAACRISPFSQAAKHLVSILKYVEMFAYMTSENAAETETEDRSVLDLGEVLSRAGYIKGFGFMSLVNTRKNYHAKILISSLSKVGRLSFENVDIEGDVKKELFALLKRSPEIMNINIMIGCTIGLSTLLELLTLIRETDIDVLGIPMPPDLTLDERNSLFNHILLCKKLRKLTISPKNDIKEKEEAEMDMMLPRLLKINASSNHARTRISPNALYFVGKFNFRKIDGVKLAENAVTTLVNTVNHSTVVFNNMEDWELGWAFRDNKIIHRGVRDVRIYDSDTKNLISYINDPLRYHGNLRRLVIQNSGLVSSDLGQASLFSTTEALFISDNEGITSLSGLKRWEILSTLKATWCGLTSIDLPHRPSTTLRELDVSFNLKMMEIPVQFALKYPNTVLRARQCGFSLLPPYSHPAIEDMGKFIRYMCACHALELISEAVGISTAPDTYIPYEYFKI